MRLRNALLFGVLLACVFTSTISVAQEEPAAPSLQKELITIKQLVDTQPENLDLYFSYAKIAERLEEYDEAISAYEHMLAQNPSLQRVKLDLALVYMKVERFQLAKNLFEGVLETKPPQKVVENVNQLLAVVNKALTRHILASSLAVGYNYDTNANSSSSTGNTSFLETSVPLEGASRKQQDTQIFGAFTLNHDYRVKIQMPKKYALTWKSNFTLYRVEQRNLTNQDISLFAVKTGPSFQFREYNTTLASMAGYNLIKLDGNPYMNVASLDASVTHALNEKLTLTASGLYEHRHFRNSPTVFTFTDRTGNSRQLKLAASYIHSKNDIFGGDITYRVDSTRRKYNNNHQIGFGLNHTHIFARGYFSTASIGYKLTSYVDADPLVSTNVRDDIERSSSFMVGRRFSQRYTFMMGYQYRSVSSNIENYQYKNHRMTTTFSISI